MARNERLVYDVGLHMGEDAEYYLKIGHQVVAFEANPSCVEYCRNKFSKEIRSGQLLIVAGAIAAPNETGKVKFFVNPTISVWSTTNPTWVARNLAAGAASVEIEVDRVDIREIFARRGMPYFLKIDIEGADNEVLDALGYFQERPEFVSIEVNTVELVKARRDLRTLDRLGYRQFLLAPQKHIAGSRIRRKSLSGEPFEHVFAEGASGPFGDDLKGVWIDRDAALTAVTSETWQDAHATLSPGAETNIALGRPATQSSTGPESTDPNPAIDAGVATNGDALSPLFFQTAEEDDPWWQVDLGGAYHVDKIVIYNRCDYRGRLRRFAVLGSNDGRAWAPLLKKENDDIFRVFAANVVSPAPARFVRVQLLGRGQLNIRECQVFGRPA